MAFSLAVASVATFAMSYDVSPLLCDNGATHKIRDALQIRRSLQRNFVLLPRTEATNTDRKK